MFLKLLLIILLLFLIGVILCLVLLWLNLRSGPVSDLSDTEALRNTRWEQFAETLREGISRIRAYPWEDVWIVSHDGLKLHGRVLKGTSEKTVILAHGYRSSGENDFCGIVDYYRENNFTVLMIDQRAHGESEGKRLSFGLRERWDMTGWICYAVENLPSELYLHGVSMGGVSLMMALPSCKGYPIKGIIADSAYDNVQELLIFQIKKKYHLPSPVFDCLISLAGSLLLGRDCKKLHAAQCVAENKVPVIIMNGSDDHMIPPGMAARFTRARNVQFVCIDGAPHAMCWLTAQGTYENQMDRFLMECSRKS